MADVIDNRDFERKPLPSGLNVLTILTFIGSAAQIIGSIYQYMTAKTNYDKKDEILQQMDNPDAPAWAKGMMPDRETFINLVTKAYENRVALLAVGIISALLCIYGAMEMRKLRKQGFTFYAVGEILPLIATAVLMGFGYLSGFNLVVGAGIPILFLVLYSMQRKHLIY